MNKIVKGSLGGALFGSVSLLAGRSVESRHKTSHETIQASLGADHSSSG
jgi:hypothetical protein